MAKVLFITIITLITALKSEDFNIPTMSVIKCFLSRVIRMTLPIPKFLTELILANEQLWTSKFYSLTFTPQSLLTVFIAR